MGTRKITFNNFHKDTRANFEIFDNKLSENILNAFKKAKRKKNFTGKFKVGSDEYELLHFSEPKRNRFFKSRQISIYFRKKRGRSVIRISDHWSETTSHKRSRKLNAGYLNTCYWTANSGSKERDTFLFSGLSAGSYDWVLLSGVCSLAKFEAI